MRHATTLRLAMTLPLALALAACSATGSQVLAPPPSTGGGAPRPALVLNVPDYSPERQARLAGEIAAAPPEAEWPGMIGDYSTLRRQACAVTPRQPGCRRICASSPEGNRPAFCQNTGS